jgi:hypothetical protein
VIAVIAAVLSVLGAGFLAPARPAFAATYTTTSGGPDGANTRANTHPMPPACYRRGVRCQPACYRRGRRCPPATTGGLATVTKLTASPNPAVVGRPVTLTATVARWNRTTVPLGTVQFEVGGVGIGTPVTTSSRGVATMTITFTAAGTHRLSAVFTPHHGSVFSSSQGMLRLPVRPSVILTMPLMATIAPAGSFSVTVTTAGTVTMSASGGTATATLIPVVVSDTRNTYPGWSVTGEAVDFTGSGTAAGATISGNQLGWAPTAASLAPGAVLGGIITPAAPGLGATAATLASASAGGGVGTSTLSADLTLAIPASTMPGPYASVLTLTAVSAAP